MRTKTACPTVADINESFAALRADSNLWEEEILERQAHGTCQRPHGCAPANGVLNPGSAFGTHLWSCGEQYLDVEGEYEGVHYTFYCYPTRWIFTASKNGSRFYSEIGRRSALGPDALLPPAIFESSYAAFLYYHKHKCLEFKAGVGTESGASSGSY